mgnify:CR=1 FL=1
MDDPRPGRPRAAAAAGLDEPSRRTVSIETGMQNSALACVLASAGGLPAAATLPGALSATVHSVMGSALARLWRGSWQPRRREEHPRVSHKRRLSLDDETCGEARVEGVKLSLGVAVEGLGVLILEGVLKLVGHGGAQHHVRHGFDDIEGVLARIVIGRGLLQGRALDHLRQVLLETDEAHGLEQSLLPASARRRLLTRELGALVHVDGGEQGLRILLLQVGEDGRKFAARGTVLGCELHDDASRDFEIEAAPSAADDEAALFKEWSHDPEVCRYDSNQRTGGKRVHRFDAEALREVC